MGKPLLKLHEIIWEITNVCHQNCSYCGSKDILNKTPIDSDNIKKIVDAIAKYPPENIDISGGNPLLVSKETHLYLVETLKAKGVQCKILFNPFNINDDSDRILQMYDWKGVSINTKKELDYFKKKSISSVANCRNTTIITNFNTGNAFLFKEIEALALQNNMMWQIQYTMYNDDNELALYSNNEAMDYLGLQIANSNSNIILADNMNSCDQCSAGKQSLGILADGSVIACLSERSWNKEIEVQGNLLEHNLSDIWKHGFIEQRFSDHKCCKDVTKCCERDITVRKEEKLPPLPIITDWTPVKPDWQPTEIPPSIFTYGVATPRTPSYPQPDLSKITCVYAVMSQPYNSSSGITNIITSTKSDGVQYLKLEDIKKSE